jgi:hypothetical protein
VIILGKAISSIEINASPEKVFDFILSDKGNDIMMEGVAEGKWTSEKPIGLGSTAHFTGIHKYNNGEEWNAEITEFTKNKSLTMLLRGANKKSHDQIDYYTCEPTTNGTKFTFSMEYEVPSIGGKLLQALGGRRMVEGWVTKMSENVKKAVEGS